MNNDYLGFCFGFFFGLFGHFCFGFHSSSYSMIKTVSSLPSTSSQGWPHDPDLTNQKLAFDSCQSHWKRSLSFRLQAWGHWQSSHLPCIKRAWWNHLRPSKNQKTLIYELKQIFFFSYTFHLNICNLFLKESSPI